MKSEVQIFLEKRKREFGICACCGRTITAEIIGENYLHWYCGGERKGDECVNLGKPHDQSLCIFNDNKEFLEEREKQQEFIRETLIAFMNEYKWANFIANGEVYKAIKSIRQLINMAPSIVAGEEVWTVWWKPLLDFDSRYPNWNEFEKVDMGLIEVDVSLIVGGCRERSKMFNADFSIAYDYKNETRYQSLLNGVKINGIENARNTLESFAGNGSSPICLFCFNKNGKREYFVTSDGHRRVSIAKLYGLERIKAEVYELINQ